MKIILLILVFGIVSLIDVPSIFKKEHKYKYLGIYSVMMLLGFVISVLLIINKAPPSPAKVIEAIIKAIK